ncbi:MAG: cation transporter [Desulfobacteraceae bacterium]|nr:cation transporter [Desulfobacteraceae bacterium]
MANGINTSMTAGFSAGKKVTIVGALTNTLLIAVKFAAGFFGHSQALIADAIHSLSDLFTDLIVLVGFKLGRNAPDEKHHFGHARIETMASAVVGFGLLATAIYIGVDAGMAIHRHEEYSPTSIALIAAGMSILFKEILFQYTIRTGRRVKSQLIVANAWHHRTDALSSIAVFIGVGAAMLNPDWHIMDAFAALLVSFFILKVGLDIIGNCLKEFIDTAPHPEVLAKITSCALSISGVQDVHDLRVRTSGGLYLIEIHIIVDGRLTVIQGHDIAKNVERCLEDRIEDFERAIIHVDPAVAPARAEF